jgi:hypothetical protein
LEAVELGTGIAQTGELDNRRDAEVQPRADWQAQQVNAPRGDILPHLASAHGEPARPEFVVQFSMHEVHLPQIGLARIARHTRAMLHGCAHVRVTLHPQPHQQPDARFPWLYQGMGRTSVHRLDNPTHRLLLF